ncbi:MAG: hypothetical protein HDP28_03820, partial [Clostridia bacterium]|nr:hypothetical protein [Clostridia bacterium]
MFFFFFFDKIHDKPIIQQAFKNICYNKMLVDGYFDVRRYLDGKISRLDFLVKLINEESVVAKLFENEYHPADELSIKMIDNLQEVYGNNGALTYLESDAIVYWIFRICNDDNERESLVKEIFSRIKDLHNIANSIQFKKGIPYNSQKVRLEFISSLSDLNNILTLEKPMEKLFYRGHSNANYLLIPSVFRNFKLKSSESKMYNELI